MSTTIGGTNEATDVSANENDIFIDREIKLQRFNEILRENHAYAERVRMLERELKQCKEEMAALGIISDGACIEHVPQEGFTLSSDKGDLSNTLPLDDLIDNRIQRGKSLAIRVLVNSIDEESYGETAPNKEHKPTKRKDVGDETILSELVNLNKSDRDVENICDESAVMITSLSHQLSETVCERDELKKLVHELRTQNEDYQKVYGDLYDFTELRHQYESLLENDYDFVSNVEFADVMSGGGGSHVSYNSVGWQQSKREIDRICNDLNQFVLDMKLKNSSESKQAG